MLPELTLTDEEQSLIAGEDGDAVALAMRILVRMAPLYGANSLLPVTRAHIDGCIYEGDAGLEFAERLARLGGKVRVPTSLNVISMDRERWRELGQAPEYAEKARRLGQAYVDMGARPTFTCVPYQTDSRPAFGEQIAWSESNAVAFANSIIGARTNRYGDYLDISCALTGRVPAAGLHLDQNRLGQVLLQLPNLPSGMVDRDDFYPVLGYLIGKLVDDEIAVVEGFDACTTEDQLKSLAAATATSGSVALFHLVGITPEAETTRIAFGGLEPGKRIAITMDDLRDARADLTTSHSSELDVVGFGSPHCSLDECRRLARLMAGARANDNVEVFITTSLAVRQLLDRNGVLMTNSAKYAHYAPGLIGVQSVYATTEDCVASAIAGRVTIVEGPWAS
jgi:cis-L-3-hydroxyproline dehydratase